MTPRGLIKATAYYNNLQAWEDWRSLADKYPELAKRFTPPDNSGWRRVDKSITALRKAIEARK